MHVGDWRLLQALINIGRDVGRQHVKWVLSQHARDIQSHIAIAKHGNLLSLKRPGARVVRVTVIPGYEVGGAVRTSKVNARDVQIGVLDRAGCENYRVIVLFDVVEL